MRPNFRFFCINRFCIGFLQISPTLFNFVFEFVEIFVIKNRLLTIKNYFPETLRLNNSGIWRLRKPSIRGVGEVVSLLKRTCAK